MPLLGTLNVLPYKDHVGNMTVGQTAYIDATALVITRRAVFIDLLTKIVLEEYFYDDVNTEYIAITRVGTGTSEKDYEVDIEMLPGYEFLMESMGVYYKLIKHSQSYLIFRKHDLYISHITNLRKEDEVPETEEELLKKLEDAIDEQRFEEADQLQKRIDALRNQKAP